jgi:hypothetical protein
VPAATVSNTVTVVVQAGGPSNREIAEAVARSLEYVKRAVARGRISPEERDKLLRMLDKDIELLGGID